MDIKDRIKELQNNIAEEFEKLAEETGIHVEAVEVTKYSTWLGQEIHEVGIRYNIHLELSV